MQSQRFAASTRTMAEILIKPIAGILTAQRELLPQVLAALAPGFGNADVIGEWRRFDHTDYYRDEMGSELFRCFVSFEGLRPPEDALGFKPLTNEIEARFSHDRKRIVNIDPGYIDTCKLVLISGKHGGHKVALGAGLYADPLLWYDKGWKALPWAFPDFRDEGYFSLFVKMRTLFKSQLKSDRLS